MIRTARIQTVKVLLAGLKVVKVERIDSTCIHVTTPDYETTEAARGRLQAHYPEHSVLVYDNETLGLLG